MKRRGFFAVLFGSIAAAFSKPANPIEETGMEYIGPGEDEVILGEWEIEHNSSYYWKLSNLPCSSKE